MPDLQTERLILRRWKDGDLDAFAALNADPRVAEFFLAPLTRERAAAMITRMEERFEIQGFGFWALEEKAGGDLVGMAGLNTPGFDAAFMPGIEVGWRLAHRFWGQGLATEAARAALAYAFGPLGLDEIVAFTARDNMRSRAVMTRLGMIHDPASDFDHPQVPEGHALRPHVLYRLRRP